MEWELLYAVKFKQTNLISIQRTFQENITKWSKTTFISLCLQLTWIMKTTNLIYNHAVSQVLFLYVVKLYFLYNYICGPFNSMSVYWGNKFGCGKKNCRKYRHNSPSPNDKVDLVTHLCLHKVKNRIDQVCRGVTMIVPKASLRSDLRGTLEVLPTIWNINYEPNFRAISDSLSNN